MDATTQLGHLLGLTGACAEGIDTAQIIKGALPVLLTVGGADAAMVLRRATDSLELSVHDGAALEPDALIAEDWTAGAGRLVTITVPAAWRESGITQVATQQLPGHLGVLVLAWSGGEPGITTPLELAVATLDMALSRRQAEDDLSDLVSRVDNAQRLANMGDYDWHIPTDTNRWSDQLYRIYGHEPQSFNASYERFLSLIHPDDRERITGVHQQAYGTGEPYQMIERIVRPDGEVRYLSSNGQVVMDESGTPVRMRGTCIDITDRVRAEEAREHIAARFRGLVESAPDAILVLDDLGQILEANPRASELLGGEPGGHLIEEMLPGSVREDGQGVEATGLDGRRLLLDVTTAAVDQADGETLVAVFLRDAAVRLAGEAMAARLGEAQLRRRQALEINDNVVQGLVAASYALDNGEPGISAGYLERTLSAARAMMDDLLEPLDGDGLRPGDLVRRTPATIGLPDTATRTRPEDSSGGADRPHRILVVDDAEDLRELLRARIDTVDGLSVVGEAADGLDAIEQARALQPDLVMLDLAMPRMDGLEALPKIRTAVPGVRVIVLSGFNQSTLAQKAMDAGADKYVVKGGSMRELMQIVQRVLAPS
jgi:PAS domain S-box-containing protein